jgi:hypothetical protein
VSSDPIDDNKNLPPWLRGVPLPPRPRPQTETPLGARPAPPATEPTPDWLRPAGEKPPRSTPASAGAASDLPLWLRDEPEQARPGADQGALPDWLRDMQSDAGTPAPSAETSNQPERAPAADALPSWLSELSGPPANNPQSSQPTPRGHDEMPDWLKETVSPEPSAAQDQLPDWLSEPSTPQAPAGPPSTGEDDSPDWLRSLVGETAAEEPGSNPDWLREQPGSAEPPAPSETPPDIPTQSQESPYDTMQIPGWLQNEEPAAPPRVDIEPKPGSDLPSWLREAGGADEAITAEPFSFEGMAGDEPGQPASSPAWLGGTQDSEETSNTLPAWLKDTVGQSEERAGAEAPAPEVPLWLQDLDRDQASEAPVETPLLPPSPEPSAPVAPQSEDLPPWLQPAADQPAAPDIPAWLREDTIPATPATPEQQEPSAEDAPAWLREDTPASATPAEEVPSWLQDTQPAQPPAGDGSAWLQDAPSSAPAASAGAEDAATLPGQTGLRSTEGVAGPPPPISPYDDLPEWLRPSSTPPPTPSTSERGAGPSTPLEDVPPWLRDDAGEPLPTAGAPGDANLPSWLRGAPSEPAPPASQPSSPATNLDWFSDQTEQLPAAPAQSVSSNELAGIELPAWLRPPETETAREEISPADARSLDWLRRLGGSEDEENGVVTAEPTPRLTPPALPTRTQAQIEAIALLERLAANPYPEAAPAPVEAQPGILRRFGTERLLYLLLLVAVVVALAMPAPAWTGLSVAPTAPGAERLFAQIDRLGENDVALVGYEWDARRSGELRPLEQAVMGHLIQHHVKLVLVSTDPQGSLLLFDLRDQLAQAGYRGGGEDYILLGYRPGAELALRSMAQDFGAVLRSDFQGSDATIGALVTDVATGKPRLTNLGDLSMVLVLADDASDVQGWMEQVRPGAQRPDGAQVPFGFLLPAEAAPIVQPYLRLPAVDHLAGKQGALAYQQLRGELSNQQIAAEAGQQRMSALGYIALFLIGALVVGGAAAAARRRT